MSKTVCASGLLFVLALTGLAAGCARDDGAAEEEFEAGVLSPAAIADASVDGQTVPQLDAASPGDARAAADTSLGAPTDAQREAQSPVDARSSSDSAPPSDGGADAQPDAVVSVGDDPCGPNAQVVTGMTRKQGTGETDLQTSGEVAILSVQAVLTVPGKPSPTRGTLFLWPGLQPLRADSTIGYGVLQPVLTWGTSCAPGSLSTFDTWWISGQYVGSPPGSLTNIKCEGGDVMRVDVGDELDINMSLEGTVWTQTITNRSNGKSVSFKRDMKGQKQQWLINMIELKGSTKPVDDLVFHSMVVKLSDSQPKACVPNVSGTTDYFAPPRASSDGKTCCISKLILRAAGIKPSTPDTP